jgi:hypothetical protein
MSEFFATVNVALYIYHCNPTHCGFAQRSSGGSEKGRLLPEHVAGRGGIDGSDAGRKQVRK